MTFHDICPYLHVIRAERPFPVIPAERKRAEAVKVHFIGIHAQVGDTCVGPSGGKWRISAEKRGTATVLWRKKFTRQTGLSSSGTAGRTMTHHYES